MKDCCKTGDEADQKESAFKKWFRIIIYVILAVIILGAIWLQINGK